MVIGLEVNDQVGDKPEGIFRLHLAMGHGHEVDATINKENVKLWTPSAMVLHLKEVTTTAEWQAKGVKNYEKTEEK